MTAALPSIAGRVPRHDLDAEAAVLSACMLDGQARDVALEALEPDHFYSDANKLVFEAIRCLALDGSPVDVLTVSQWLRAREKIQRAGGAGYLGHIVDATPAVAHVGAHCKIVRQAWRVRQVVAFAHETFAQGYGDIGDPEAWIDGREATLHALAHEARQEGALVPVKDVLTDTFREISEAAKRGCVITGLATHYVDLDRKTAGLHGGQLIIVAARPGVGKSSWVRNVAMNVATPGEIIVPTDDGYGTQAIETEGGAVALFSLEMPRNEIAAAMVCCEARVDLGRLRQGRLTQDDWGQLTSASSVLANAPIWIDDTPGITLFYLRAKLRRLRAQLERDRKSDPKAPQLKLAIVDYLQLMRGAGIKGQSREQEIAEISRGLKELAKELGIPIIALSQLNRDVEKRSSRSKDKGKRPMLSDLRESGSLEQDADVVIFLYRPEMDDPDNSDWSGIAELIVAKQRNGPTGTVRVRFVRNCTRFENLAPGEYAELNEEEWG